MLPACVVHAAYGNPDSLPVTLAHAQGWEGLLHPLPPIPSGPEMWGQPPGFLLLVVGKVTSYLS